MLELDPSLKPELVARVLAINIVSWHWNPRGLWHHVRNGNWSKLFNSRVRGVVAEKVQEQLGPLVPDVTERDGNVLKVNYELLYDVVFEAARLLDEQYQHLSVLPVKDRLSFEQLVRENVSGDAQARAVGILRVTKIYRREIMHLQGLAP